MDRRSFFGRASFAVAAVAAALAPKAVEAKPVADPDGWRSMKDCPDDTVVWLKLRRKELELFQSLRGTRSLGSAFVETITEKPGRFNSHMTWFELEENWSGNFKMISPDTFAVAWKPISEVAR